MKILHQRADGPEEAVGLTKEDREQQVRQKTRQRQRQRQRLTKADQGGSRAAGEIKTKAEALKTTRTRTKG